MEKKIKIIIGIIITLVIIIGLITVLGSFNNNSTSKSSDGLLTHEIEGFEFKTPSDLKWAISMAGTSGFLKNDIYEFKVGIDQNIQNIDAYTNTNDYKSETIDGITYKYSFIGWKDDDGINDARISVYFEKNGKIFYINCFADEEKASKEFILNTTETIIKTMTPT
jgi:hypothetical protein